MAVNGTESIQNGKLNKVEFLSDHIPISSIIIVDVFMDFFFRYVQAFTSLLLLSLSNYSILLTILSFC